MKKFILSALLVLSYGTYAVLNQPAQTGVPAVAPIAANDTKPAPQSATSQASAPKPAAILSDEDFSDFFNEGDDGLGSVGPATQAPAQTQPASQPVAPTPAPVSTPTPAPATKPKGQYADGTYTGAPADAYYGTVQVQVTISGGRLTDVQFLGYPSDRSTSRQINGVAMPYLIQEAIQAQNANVATVSGASHTSAAFRQSLGDALTQAKA